VSEGRSTEGTRVSLTMRRCAILTCPAGKDRQYYHDTQMQALCLCVTAAGTRTFYVWRRVGGRGVRIKLGRFPGLSLDLARKEAQRINGEVAQGRDPQAARLTARGEPTLGQLFAHFLERHAKPHKKTWDEDQRQWDHYLARWKSRRLSAVQKADVQALHAKIGTEHGTYQANRVLALLSALFNKADEVGYRGPNPCQGVKRFREKSRERFLQADELPRFFAALDAEPDETMRDYFLVSLLVGARRGNTMAMRFDELNLDVATWTIPDTKNGQPLTVPLVPEVVDVLRRRRLSVPADCPWVFPGRKGYSSTGHITEPKGAWQRLLKRAGIADLRIHDLRRTLGSWQAANGVSLPIIGKSLGHKNTSTTAVYARLNLDPVRAAVGTAAAAMLAAARTTSAGPKGEEE